MSKTNLLRYIFLQQIHLENSPVIKYDSESISFYQAPIVPSNWYFYLLIHFLLEI